MFFALCDPTRRAILARIAGGEGTVTAIAAPFAMSLAAVSKHIRVLEQAGLLERSKQGREHHLRLVAGPLRDAADWVEGFREFWTDHLDRIKELAERKARDRAQQKIRNEKGDRFMTTAEVQEAIQTLHVKKDVLIAAPIDVVFETLLESPTMPGAMSLKLEPWPGGRWYRDLGDNAGHLWGHVQVIKPPKLLELCGPMFMSYPVASHVQYRLTEEGNGTRLTLTHQAIGLITPEHRTGVQMGWTESLAYIQKAAEAKRAKR